MKKNSNSKRKRIRQTERHQPNSKWFRAVLAEKGILQAEVAKKAGMDKSALSKALSGKRRFTLKESTAIAQTLGLPISDLLAALGIALDAQESNRSVEVEGWLDGQSALLLRSREEAGGLRGQRTAPCPFPDRDIRVARIQSAGTEFDGLDGALVYWRESKAKGVDQNAIGRLALVQLGTGREEIRLLRVIRRGYAPGRYNLTSLAGRLMEESAHVECVHSVVWLKL